MTRGPVWNKLASIDSETMIYNGNVLHVPCCAQRPA